MEIPSAYALAFGEKRFADAMRALKKLSPSLEASVSREAGKGGLFERMKGAGTALSRASDGLSSEESAKILTELKSSLGKSFTIPNARALLKAHAGGLTSLASEEGLGAAILLDHAGRLRKRIEEYSLQNKGDSATLGAAVTLLETWVRSLLTQSSPDDPHDPVRALSSSKDEEDARNWSLRLLGRCSQLSDDEAVQDLLRGALLSMTVKK